MKTAKRIILCMLAMVMLVSFYCVNIYAYDLGSYTEKNNNQNELFTINVWNVDNQTSQLILYVELTEESASNFSFGACFASIYGMNRDTGKYEDRDGENVLDFYHQAHVLHETDISYFKGTVVSSCIHSTVERTVEFDPMYGKGTAIVGQIRAYDISDYAVVLEELDGWGGRKRDYFVPQYEKTVTYRWVSSGNDFIEMP